MKALLCVFAFAGAAVAGPMIPPVAPKADPVKEKDKCDAARCRARAAFEFERVAAEANASAVAPVPRPKDKKNCPCGDKCKCDDGKCPACPAVEVKVPQSPVYREVWTRDSRGNLVRELVPCADGKCNLPR